MSSRLPPETPFFYVASGSRSRITENVQECCVFINCQCFDFPVIRRLTFPQLREDLSLLSDTLRDTDCLYSTLRDKEIYTKENLVPGHTTLTFIDGTTPCEPRYHLGPSFPPRVSSCDTSSHPTSSFEVPCDREGLLRNLDGKVPRTEYLGSTERVTLKDLSLDNVCTELFLRTFSYNSKHDHTNDSSLSFRLQSYYKESRLRTPFCTPPSTSPTFSVNWRYVQTRTRFRSPGLPSKTPSGLWSHVKIPFKPVPKSLRSSVFSGRRGSLFGWNVDDVSQ